MYANVESNIYNDRNQELPTVTKTEVISITKGEFSYNNETYESYEIKVNIEYEKELDYPKEYNLILINNDKYLQVVKGE